MGLTRTIQIPNFHSNEYDGFLYYILTQGHINYPDVDFIKVPGMTNTISKILVVACWASSLITYRSSNNELFTIPNHDYEVYGYPIFTSDKDSFNKENDPSVLCWNCPQNYFLNRASAEEMLNILKKKHGTVYNAHARTGQYNIINPVGRFNS